MKKRIISIWLPRWPTDRHASRQSPGATPDKPLVLTVMERGTARIFASNGAAATLDLRPGMTLTDARAAVPDIAAHPADPDDDRQALARLARWCRRWSPRTAPAPAGDAMPENGVRIDATGCAHLFGGEAAMLAAIHANLADRGIEARVVIAATHALAWGAARYDLGMAQQPTRVIAPENTRAALDRLPVEALAPAKIAAALRRLGLTHIGALRGRARAPLARRFGVELVHRLDQATGVDAEPFQATAPATRFRQTLNFIEPLLTPEVITIATGQALEKLCAQLAAQGRGARRLGLTLIQGNGDTAHYQAGMATPVCDVPHCTRLLGERLAQLGIDPGFGIELLEVVALRTAPLTPRQCDLDGSQNTQAGEENIARLTDTLEARIGEGRVLRAGTHESHLPERAAFWQAQPGDKPAPQPRVGSQPKVGPRPLLLLSRPEPVEAIASVPDGPPRAFTWRKVRHRITRAQGPERIAPEWWRTTDQPGTPALTRDYFHVETQDGRRFWLYRDGLYGRETETARWFVHGAGP